MLRDKKRLPMPSYSGLDSSIGIDIWNLYIREIRAGVP